MHTFRAPRPLPLSALSVSPMVSPLCAFRVPRSLSLCLSLASRSLACVCRPYRTVFRLVVTMRDNTHEFYHVTSGPRRVDYPACADARHAHAQMECGRRKGSSIQLNHRPASPRVALGGWGVGVWEVGGWQVLGSASRSESLELDLTVVAKLRGEQGGRGERWGTGSEYQTIGSQRVAGGDWYELVGLWAAAA